MKVLFDITLIVTFSCSLWWGLCFMFMIFKPNTLPWYISYTVRAWEYWQLKHSRLVYQVVHAMIHVNLKSHGNKILSFVASLSRNHYCTTAGWDCLELNLMRLVRIDVCKIQFQLFWNSNSLLNGFSRISPKHHGKRFFSRGFFHLGVPLQVLLFLRFFFSVANLASKFPSANVIEEVSLFLIRTRLCRRKS